jgi:hypothetical protein
MMTDEQMLAAYEGMMQLSRRMLASTEQGQWEEMTQQQDELSVLLAMLRDGDEGQARPAAVMAMKKGLIEEIMASQKATLELALPWRASIAAMLDSAGSAKRVAHAYGQVGG